MGRPYPLYPIAERKCFPGVTTVIHATVTPLYRTLQSTRTWVTAAGINFVFEIAAKPLQIETRLLLTAYNNSLSPYPTVPSPIPYDVRLSRNTCVTDRWRTDRRHIVSQNRSNGRTKTTCGPSSRCVVDLEWGRGSFQWKRRQRWTRALPATSQRSGVCRRCSTGRLSCTWALQHRGGGRGGCGGRMLTRPTAETVVSTTAASWLLLSVTSSLYMRAALSLDRYQWVNNSR